MLGRAGEESTLFLARWWNRWRYRRVWHDPVRRYRTLQSFSETEQDGGRDLMAAAARVTDPRLREHLLRHAADEVRHAYLFRARAAEVRELAMSGRGAGEKDAGRVYDLAGARAGLELDAHGFFNAGIYDEIGEVPYVAMLHIAEQRAADVFELHLACNGHDPATRDVFSTILVDERYHISYTGGFLAQWRKDGRGREVDEALSAAKASRFLGAWKRIGLRSGASFSRVVLFAMYWTLLAPFGLLARRHRASADWQPPRDAGADEGTAQY